MAMFVMMGIAAANCWSAVDMGMFIDASGMLTSDPLWGVFTTTLAEELEASGYASLSEAWRVDAFEAEALSQIAQIAYRSPVGRIVTIHRGPLIERITQTAGFDLEKWRAAVATEYIIHQGGKVFDSW